MNVFDINAIAPALAIAGATVLVLLAGASYFSNALIRLRSRRLPNAVRDRLTEEWLAEVAELHGRRARLLFAAGVFLVRNRSLEPDAVEPSVLPLPAWERTPYADRGDRVIAYLIDQVIVFAAALPLGFVIARLEPVGLFAVRVLFSTAIYLFLYVYCVLRFGGSPGKILMKLRIVPIEGGPLTLGHALLRTAPLLAFVLVDALIGVMHLMFNGSGGSIAQAAAAGPAAPVINMLTIVFCLYGTTDLFAFLQTTPPRSFRDVMAGTAVALRAPGAIEVPEELPPTRSTSLFR